MAPWAWQWHLHLDVVLVVVGLEAAYLLALRYLGPGRVPVGEPAASRAQITAFTLGVVTIWVAAGWPIHDLAESYLYSVHMVQHLLLSLVAPPLLLLGTPAWLVRTLLRPTSVFRVVRRLSRPLPALLLFNLVIALTHWTVVVDLTARSELAHFSFHAALFGTALLMWMPVVSPLIELPRLPYPGQMLYLFAQSLLPTVPASFLTFGSTPLYQVYADAPRTFGISAITDQRLAGLFMKIVGGLLLWSVIAVLFFKWHAQESADGSDALQWRDLERDLARMRLSR
jgi:putative membrane protein